MLIAARDTPREAGSVGTRIGDMAWGGTESRAGRRSLQPPRCAGQTPPGRAACPRGAPLEGEPSPGDVAVWEDRSRGAGSLPSGGCAGPKPAPCQIPAAGVCRSSGAVPISAAVFLYKVPFVAAAIGELVPPFPLAEASPGLPAALE